MLASLFVNLDLTLLTIFGIVLAGFLLWEHRRGEKLEINQLVPYIFYMIMFRTTWGLKRMNEWATRYSSWIRLINPIIITTGVLGVLALSYFTIQAMLGYLANPVGEAPLQLVLPIESSATFYIPFFYWIIAIFIIASIHEFAHGVIARYHKIKIKSSGFAFLGIVLPIIPAAFVEPDEKQIVKKSWEQQVAVYAAGPFINIVLFFALLLVVFAVSPMASTIVDSAIQDGIEIAAFSDNSSLESAGASIGEIIETINNTPITNLSALQGFLATTTPGDIVEVRTDAGEYSVELGEGPNGIGLLGFNGALPVRGPLSEHPYRVQQGVLAADGMAWTQGPTLPAPVSHGVIWTTGLLFWTAVLSLGIGIFNLLPIFIADGARILWVTLKEIFGLSEQRAGLVTFGVGWVFIILILAVLFAQMNLFSSVAALLG